MQNNHHRRKIMFDEKDSPPYFVAEERERDHRVGPDDRLVLWSKNGHLQHLLIIIVVVGPATTRCNFCTANPNPFAPSDFLKHSTFCFCKKSSPRARATSGALGCLICQVKNSKTSAFCVLRLLDNWEASLELTVAPEMSFGL